VHIAILPIPEQLPAWTCRACIRSGYGSRGSFEADMCSATDHRHRFSRTRWKRSDDRTADPPEL